LVPRDFSLGFATMKLVVVVVVVVIVVVAIIRSP
jgi:hypothetical protein